MEKVEGIGETREEVERMKKEKLFGVAQEKRVIVKPEMAAKQDFKWDARDDTTRGDINPLYKERARLEVRKTADGFAPRRRRKQGEQSKREGLHWSEKKREEMSQRDWRIFREDHNMSSRGGRVPMPARTWSETGLSDDVLEAVRRVGYERPTPIQMQAIPCALVSERGFVVL